MGSRSIGALLLFLALPMVIPIPAPGISVVFGIPLIFISGQLFWGHQAVWLPASIARRSISRADLRNYVKRAVPTLHKIEGALRPRWRYMANDRVMQLIGAVCLFLSLVITLPIPFGHLVPGASISVMALGIIEKDGLATSIGLIVALFALLVVVFATTGLIAIQRALF